MVVLRWGIAGAGKISDDFAAALSSMSAEDHMIVAVAARNPDRAAAFAEKYAIVKSYGSYEELASDADVDVVYIGTINPTHYEVCKLMLVNNKHVLCEKSLTLLLKHTMELIKLAAEKKKFFQEAVWSRFFPAYQRLREAINNGSIGDVKLITVNFAKNITVGPKTEGSGTLMSLGVYPLQLALWALGTEMPEQIKACGVLTKDGIDLTVALTLLYKSGAMAQLNTSFVVGPIDDAKIHGTMGSITFPKKFHCPTEMDVNGQRESFPIPPLRVPVDQLKRPGFIYQAQEVRNCIQKGLLVSPLMTHQESIVIATIMEEAERQIGMTFADLYE